MASGAALLARFVGGIPRYLRHRVTIDAARDAIGLALDRRDANFLRMAETCIYANPTSPYVPLLAMAGCELGDLRDSVDRRGLQATLVQLRDEGVYVSFEEFKGRESLIRSGRHIDVRPEDFRNPHVRTGLRAPSGGTTGPSTQSTASLEHLADEAPARMLGYSAHELLGAPTAGWRPRLPAPAGITGQLIDARFGHVHEQWFAPPSAFAPATALRYRAATEAIRTAARAGGVRMPRLRFAPYDRPEVVAAWAARRSSDAERVVVRTGVSLAVRVGIAAHDGGLDVSKVTFVGAGEPPTPAKVASIERSGARCVPTYVAGEVGHLGFGCARPASTDDVHFFSHRFAVTSRPREVPMTGVSVDAFLITSLFGTEPSIALNLENGDHGIVGVRQCGCELEAAGLTTHLQSIESVTKLTGESVTLVGSDLVRSLQEVLPARFGGSPLDYQLVESEDATGFTKLHLLINPRLPISDESVVVRALLEGLGSTRHATELREIWTRLGTVSVRRAEPVLTARGKQPALVRRSTAAGTAGGVG
jgi:hypothetical protein